MLYDKDIQCVNCKTCFKTKKVFSYKVSVAKLHEDGYKTFRKINPSYYDIYVCPKCGYAFGERINSKITEPQKEILSNYFQSVENIDKFSDIRDIDLAVRANMLALVIAYNINENSYLIASLLHKISWLFKEAEQKESENRFLHLAATFYEKSLDELSFKEFKQKEEQVYFLLMFIYFRLDERDKAKEQYSYIQKNRKRFDVSIYDKATELWHDNKKAPS